MSVIRSASLHGFAELVATLGGDPRALARRAGLPLSALESFDVLVPADAVGQVMELAADELGCPDFGLRMSAFQELDGLGSLAVALRNSATLGDAFEAARRFLRLHNQGSTVSVEPDPYEVRGVMGLRHVWDLGASGYVQVRDRGMLNLHRVVVTLAGPDYGLRSVELAHRPRIALADYAAAFGGVRVHVDRPTAMLRMPEALLRRPIADADGALREMAMFYLAQQRPADDLAATARTRAVVAALLGGGDPSIGAAAAVLETTPRTLQRRLAAEGTRFGAVVDDVRRVRALELLEREEMSMADVAAMLDVDQATFARSARRWWGVTPSEKRRRLG